MGERALGSLAVLLAVTGFAQGQDLAGPLPQAPTPYAATPAAWKGEKSWAPMEDGPPADAGSDHPAADRPWFEAPGADGEDEHEPGDSEKKKELSPPNWPLPCGCGPEVWIDGDFLYYWVKGAPVPVPLVTTGPPAVPPQLGFGTIGNPSTQTLLGDQSLSMGQFSGGRVTAGTWIGGVPRVGYQTLGAEISFFTLGRRSTSFDFASNALGLPVLSRPIVDALRQQESAYLVSTPSTNFNQLPTPGRIHIGADTEFWGGEANLFKPLCGTPCWLFGVLAGFRYLNLEDSLTINQTTRVLNNGEAFLLAVPVAPPATLRLVDDFQTRNNFYGGQIGAQAVYRHGPFAVTAFGKLAVGSMHEVIHISGQTQLGVIGLPTLTVPGGLLALKTNIGDYGRYVTSLVPEAGLNFSCQVLEHVAVTAGYNFLYAGTVLRPGPQIDRIVNPTVLPTSATYTPIPLGPPRPQFDFHNSDFWAQGFTVGLNISF
jgi:hypothetical protein